MLNWWQRQWEEGNKVLQDTKSCWENWVHESQWIREQDLDLITHKLIKIFFLNQKTLMVNVIFVMRIKQLSLCWWNARCFLFRDSCWWNFLKRKKQNGTLMTFLKRAVIILLFLSWGRQKCSRKFKGKGLNSFFDTYLINN